jgi:hypothetical protein
VLIQVEVSPLEPYRWIADIQAPAGSFSTETTTASDVRREVAASIQSVLGVSKPAFELVDNLGEPWSPSVAPAQMQRLGVAFDERTWIPTRQPWWQRLLGRRPQWLGDCPACGHDWREHVPSDGECGECRYEIEHEEPEAPTAACRVMPSLEVRLASGDPRKRRSR